MALPKIYTIGYEGASVEDLIATLQNAGVKRLIDIRSSPYSRRSEFSKDEISAALKDELSRYETAEGIVMESSSWKICAKNPG